jgi:hypothetical protein
MDRRTFVATLAAGTFATAQHAARAQQAGKIPRVGVLAIVGGEASNLESFYQGLRDLGWVDGQNIRIDFAVDAKSSSQRLQRISRVKTSPSSLRQEALPR